MPLGDYRSSQNVVRVRLLFDCIDIELENLKKKPRMETLGNVLLLFEGIRNFSVAYKANHEGCFRSSCSHHWRRNGPWENIGTEVFPSWL